MNLRIIIVSLLLVESVCTSDLRAQPASFIGAQEPGRPVVISPLSPDDQKAAFTLAPGFEIELVAAEEPGIGKFITVDWDQKGRMWTMTALDYPVDGNENAAQATALYSAPGKDKVLVFDTPFIRGRQKPRIFAEGLAIPLGILPYRNGVYVQHGPDIVFLSDQDGDGKAEKRDVILSGFGVQDSHLFPHQFTRAPGNWIWMAQGAFNTGKVRTAKGDEIQFDATRMAKFRTDGSEFGITSQGPCNIWGLVIGAEGEAWIQEANDYGFPAMPFHEFANYPGCSDRLFKSYAPEFPGTADFRVEGTGLSGLALSDKSGAWPEPYADIMYVANPITRRINSIKIHRDGPRYRLERLPDLIASSDEMFRPVSIQFGPDGCLYIVDWYNKIISHNEVPRNHPERDKQRGRIWRVRHKEQRPFAVPDFTTLSGDELLERLGGPSLRQSHLAWQAITDRQLAELAPKLNETIVNPVNSAPKRIGALWALEGLKKVDAAFVKILLNDGNRNVRREAIRALGDAEIPNLVTLIAPLADDPDPEVRAQVIRTAGALISRPWNTKQILRDKVDPAVIALLARCAREPLSEPMAPATRNGKLVKVREAYEREFERYLVRLFLEQRPEAVTSWLGTSAAESLPVENRLLLALAITPRESAIQVARLLPHITRIPGREEILRLAEYPDQPGVKEALAAILRNSIIQDQIVEILISLRTRLNAPKLHPLLNGIARELIGSERQSRELAFRLISAFQLTALEPELHQALETAGSVELRIPLIRTIRELGNPRVPVMVKLLENETDARIRDEVVLALASARSEAGANALFSNWSRISMTQRRTVLGQLATAPVSAKAIVQGVQTGVIAKDDLDPLLIDKLNAVIPGDPELAKLMNGIAGLFRPVLHLDGTDEAYSEIDLVLDGPFTVETWVRFEPGIDNRDGILGIPGVLDMNFYDGKFRVWVGGGVGDAIVARKPVIPDVWMHIAVTRDEKGYLRLYQDGLLDNDRSKSVPQKFEKPRIAWTTQKGGTAGVLEEFRIWNRMRSQEEIAATFDRGLDENSTSNGLIYRASGTTKWGRLASGAKVEKTMDPAPLLTAAEAISLDAKFSRVRALTEGSGDATRGKALAIVCKACHLIQGQGTNLGPNLSGAGAIGTEALLRNILTPHAAMEPGYRIFRVELKNGEIQEGMLVSDERDAVVLRIPGTDDRRIERNKIENGRFLRRSLMPEGLLDGFQDQDITDLFAYLKTLR